MSNQDKGFASMDKDKVKEIAKKGGEARKEELGPEGYAEMGREGGKASHSSSHAATSSSGNNKRSTKEEKDSTREKEDSRHNNKDEDKKRSSAGNK